MKEESTNSEEFTEKRARARIARLQAEIDVLQAEIKNLRDERIEYIEIIATMGDPGDKNIAEKVKYMHDKYMLSRYHESRTKPIRK
jgi:uncharacterized protein YlxW (UPF0749 family)